MNLTQDELQKNYQMLIAMIDKFIESPDRKEKLKEFYNTYKKVITYTPASDVDFYHNAFKGGYCEHVIRVIQFSFKVSQQYKELGFELDYTDEELFMVALNHDLGKIGDEDGQLYLYNESEWHRKNQGRIYKKNGVIDFMEVQDRSLYLLQSNGINLSKNEYLGIKLHDGVYAKANEYYYVTFKQENKLKTLLPYVVHQADMMASLFEYRRWLLNKSNVETNDTKELEGMDDKLKDVFNKQFK